MTKQAGIPTVLSKEETCRESLWAAGNHLLHLMLEEQGYDPPAPSNWHAHWANVHLSAAFHIYRKRKPRKARKEKEKS